MDQERLTALCESHRMRSKLTLYERPAIVEDPPGWDVLLTYIGPADDFSRPAWIDLRETVIAEMQSRGYQLLTWYAISDDRQHGMGWARRGTVLWDSDPRAWHPGFQLRRQRLADGLCVACGQNLDATPDRCPMCGTVSPSARQP